MPIDFDDFYDFDLDMEIDLASLPIVPKGRYSPERQVQSIQILVSVDSDLYHLLKVRAACEQCSISEMTTVLLQRALEN